MLLEVNQEQTRVRTLGEPKLASPLHLYQAANKEGREVLYYPFVGNGSDCHQGVSFEASAPPNKIYFDPNKVHAAIVTCGGICPGLNDVIRSITHRLWFGYGVRNIVGVRYGLRGFISKYNLDFMPLNPHVVSNIHELGGTVLGSSRGEQDMDEIVDCLDRQNINQLYMIGGDGTLRATRKIEEEIERRGLKISVVGIPKTIDNDINFVSRSFGFETAVEAATHAISSAHAEAKSFPYGIGLVKLMGRYSGFIAAHAALSQRDVNFVLVPEVDFDMDGEHGFLAAVKQRLLERDHAVVVVAEGAGQRYLSPDAKDKDASGNVKLKDVGTWLKDEMTKFFKSENIDINLKYIDPSYIIRSVPANTADGLYCATLGQNAVHAAMAGKTGLVVSMWHGVYCMLPIELAVAKRKQIDPHEGLWLNVLESTGQPTFKPHCDL